MTPHAVRLYLALVVCSLVAMQPDPATAQSGTGSSAEPQWDRSVLPIPRPPFRGKAGLRVGGSTSPGASND